MTAPRIPRHRPAVIPVGPGPRWYESTVNRVIAIVVFATFGGIAVHAAAVWLVVQP